MQRHMELAPPRKREREDEEEFAELRGADAKRRHTAIEQQSRRHTPPQELPLRLYQNSPPPLFSKVTVTPYDSAGESDDEPALPSHDDVDMRDGPFFSDNNLSLLASSPTISPPNLRWPMPPPPRRRSPHNISPHHNLRSPAMDPSISGGRIPTPMYGSFSQQKPPSLDTIQDDGVSPRTTVPLGPPSLPRLRTSKPPDLFIRPDAPIPTYRHNRPDLAHDSGFPSPICEAEVDTPTLLTGHRLSQLSVDEVMDIDEEDSTYGSAGPVDNAEGHVMKDVDVNVPTPRRVGRSRSGAFYSPRSPRTFMMGRRDDCEKCRNKVPGHLAHWN